MACARRDGEADGEPDRSLRHMLRAIAEERSRAGLRHDISGLGESGGAGGEAAGSPRGERQPRPGSLSTTAAAAPVVFHGPSRLSPGASRDQPPLHCLKCPWRKMVRRPRAHRTGRWFLGVSCEPSVLGWKRDRFFGASCRCSLLCGSQTLSRDSEPDASLLCLNDFTPLAVV